MSLAFAVAAGAGAALYAPVLSGLVRDWLTEASAAHGAFVIAAAAFVAFQRRRVAQTTPRRPSPIGFVALAAAMLVYLLGTLTGDLFVQRASLPMAMAALVAALGGGPHLRLYAGPIALVALAIPLPAVIVTRLTLPLQLMASQIAAAALEASQVHVVRHGNLLVLDRVTLEVADVCSGLRSIAALLSLAAVTVTLVPFAAWRRVLLLAAVLPVAIAGNGLRIAATGALATQIGESAVRGLIHELTGFAGFIVMCGVLFAIVRLTSRFGERGSGAIVRAA